MHRSPGGWPWRKWFFAGALAGTASSVGKLPVEGVYGCGGNASCPAIDGGPEGQAECNARDSCAAEARAECTAPVDSCAAEARGECFFIDSRAPADVGLGDAPSPDAGADAAKDATGMSGS
jgi:hypothetical protein